VDGGTYFFTVTLRDRKRAYRVEWIDELLREAVRDVLHEQPFHIDAWVVVPEHTHALSSRLRLFQALGGH
jgi:putative transposase